MKLFVALIHIKSMNLQLKMDIYSQYSDEYVNGQELYFTLK